MWILSEAVQAVGDTVAAAGTPFNWPWPVVISHANTVGVMGFERAADKLHVGFV